MQIYVLLELIKHNDKQICQQIITTCTFYRKQYSNSELNTWEDNMQASQKLNVKSQYICEFSGLHRQGNSQ